MYAGASAWSLTCECLGSVRYERADLSIDQAVLPFSLLRILRLPRAVPGAMGTDVEGKLWTSDVGSDVLP